MLLRCTRPGCQCLPKDRSHLAHSPPVAKITLHGVSDGKLLGLDGGKLALTKGARQLSATTCSPPLHTGGPCVVWPAGSSGVVAKEGSCANILGTCSESSAFSLSTSFSVASADSTAIRRTARLDEWAGATSCPAGVNAAVVVHERASI